MTALVLDYIVESSDMRKTFAVLKLIYLHFIFIYILAFL